MKYISRNKVLLCFRPVMDMEAVLESERGNDIYSPSNESITFADAHNKRQMKGPTSPVSQCTVYSGESEISRPRKRSFTRAVKAIFFGTIVKRSGNQKEFSRSKRSSSMDSERRPFMALSSSSTMSDESENDRKTHRDFSSKQRKIKMGCSNVEAGLCMLMISLGITVCWGRFCAILFTSVWLYLIPLRKDELAQAEMKKERKSVIMKTDARKGRWHQLSDVKFVYLICILSLLLLLLLLICE